MIGDDFMRTFSTCFALLGLKLLFGNKQVTMGSVLLLGCISAAVSSAWTGGGSAWVEVNVANVLNASLHNRGGLFGLGPEPAQGMLRTLMCRLGAIPLTPSGQCPDDDDMPEPVRDEL